MDVSQLAAADRKGFKAARFGCAVSDRDVGVACVPLRVSCVVYVHGKPCGGALGSVDGAARSMFGVMGAAGRAAVRAADAAPKAARAEPVKPVPASVPFVESVSL